MNAPKNKQPLPQTATPLPVNELPVNQKPLPEDATLCVFANDQLIYKNSGKWLIPLFEFENFMKTYTGNRHNLCVHDSAIGKAAAVLMLRQGVNSIHGDIVSRLAVDFVNEYNMRNCGKTPVTLTYGTLVDRIKCATEEQLAPLGDLEKMYSLLLERLAASRK